jgi:hypothetical protein
MVAILLAGGVLLGFGAIAIDVGQFYVEREELQSGADAAAMAIAKACLTNSPHCVDRSHLISLAQVYANANAADGRSRVATVCGFLPGKLNACPAPNNNLTACLGAAPAKPTRWVEVRLSTLTASMQTVLPPTFAAAVLHQPGYTGTSVGACSRTAWSPTILSVFAMTISTCQYNSATRSDTLFAAEPPYPPLPARTREVTIYTAGSRVQANCGTAITPGWTAPGPFAWLSSTNAACTLGSIPADRSLTGSDPGAAPSSTCEGALSASQAAIGSIMYIVVYEERRNLSGPTTLYRAAYVVPFVVSGYSFAATGTAHRARSWRTNNYPCTGTNRCISGFFIGPAQPLDAIGVNTSVALVG